MNPGDALSALLAFGLILCTLAVGCGANASAADGDGLAPSASGVGTAAPGRTAISRASMMAAGEKGEPGRDGLRGVNGSEGLPGDVVIHRGKTRDAEEGKTMRMTVKADGTSIVFELNDSRAARDLYGQLPLRVEVEDYGGKEKIYYPPRKLDIADTPPVRAARPGTLAYYAPWGDVVMFYGGFGAASGLYELGSAVQGGEAIRSLRGTIRVEAVPSP